ncbi:MAG: hypothetical protein EOP31_00425 [Rhodococcus sp. (in: high G+C Gram-positive bacteria)]|uniref:hypothetical protein n=1 Tax=Rhodococcus sp. TaxID=1831 RepID=UPI00120B86AC|nr:hypothetical protein [Rhodococcus sp. (in: high G+C Gram-positive bacteria)]RZL27026.1 MAG: hypothetical protein EOP31_00425 [Rhodococcus sp. (in: high G+C Gram-positive bacteria)]
MAHATQSRRSESPQAARALAQVGGSPDIGHPLAAREHDWIQGFDYLMDSLDLARRTLSKALVAHLS